MCVKLTADKPITVLLDRGIFIHSEYMIPVVRKQEISWGPQQHTLEVHGLMRKEPNPDPSYQKQIDALITVGNLIRSGRIRAFTSSELTVESMRGNSKNQFGNALEDCKIESCESPVERTKFQVTGNILTYFSKGGRKDGIEGRDHRFTQIGFFKFLKEEFNSDFLSAIIQIEDRFGLTQFEIENLENIDELKFLLERAGSPENYPDMFHYWTASRNGLDAFLTLEKRLPNLLSNIAGHQFGKFKFKTKVVRPLGLLELLGIEILDIVPLEYGKFYHYHEVPRPVTVSKST